MYLYVEHRFFALIAYIYKEFYNEKNIKFLLPMLAVALLLGVSSVSCASNVKGKTFKEEDYDINTTMSFITKTDCVLNEDGSEFKGTYSAARKKITCEFRNIDGSMHTIAFDILNAKN